MTDKEWEELDEMMDVDSKSRDRFYELLHKTKNVVEHPEGYNGVCLCQLCCSYGV